MKSIRDVHGDLPGWLGLTLLAALFVLASYLDAASPDVQPAQQPTAAQHHDSQRN